MAKMISDTAVIQVSKLIRDDQQSETMISEEMLTTLIEVLEQLAGEGSLVEVSLVRE